MPSPFPGMDPFIEDPQIWRGFHHYLADEIVRRLSRDLGPRYYADVEVEVAIEEVTVSRATATYSDAAVLDRSKGAGVGEPASHTDYVVLVNRSGGPDFRTSEIWPISLDQPLPVLPVPLLPPDAPVALDLGETVRSIYEGYGYERRIDYSRPVPPPRLRPEMQRWVSERVPWTGSG